ncbi:hypothetical protein ASPWEDRAFT_28029 [Aspergillus wentii DTO 134E9]|uniref:Uncharacterized protein n=1 Tax=Aspergillus wentii DTO 134E9 TaxID=1073089 RepID=A0A1L9RKF2_ASPWE|nr:uncharacterized protein ASPWEDRAFT_28029 [Aspergillus wentii DTO 134E9]OJJ35391.1 hypothetical protein ASPWEDRAFT_28029 [Aspergillus wentii DTO 134E9]
MASPMRCLRTISKTSSLLQYPSRQLIIPARKPTEDSNLDRQSLHPERAETALSGTDNEVGDHQSSYDPSITTPEGEFKLLEDECRLDGSIDPLFVSPANREYSRLSPMMEMIHYVEKRDPSAKGWTRKHKEVRIRGLGDSEFDPYVRLLRGLREIQKRSNGKSSSSPAPF